MLHWTMHGELYSLLVLFVLFIRYHTYEGDLARVGKLRLFTLCLLLSIGFILLNLLCVWGLSQPGLLPRWANLVLNSLYFVGAIHLCSLYAYLIFDDMLAHVYSKHCLKRAVIGLSTVTAAAYVLVIANFFTGILFTIDPSGVYRRGPWNRVFYLLMLVELILVGICYVRNRSSISQRMIYVIRSLPPIVVLLCALQILFPDILLNGTICAVASLVIFLSFRSHTDSRDSLTGAGSRKAFLSELSLRTGSGQSLQFLQIAVMNIADINLRYGHKAGDDLLYEVANYLRRANPHGQIFRTGSTTFTLILPLESEAGADARLAAIQERLREDWYLGEIWCQLVCAIAELRCHDLSDSPATTVEQLEYTLALAKKNPPLARFDDAVRQELQQRIHLTNLLRRSIDEGRFQVVYQPIYCCHRDLFCSAEALLRLNDENGSPIRPDVFIPLSEETGMIGELTWVVLEDICRTLKSDRLPGLESISINLSMNQFLDPRLPQQIHDCLTGNGVPAEKLRVEITERFILHDAVFAARQMQALENLGIQVYMDDFGTGYSNLSSVLHYPFSFIKLDRSLICPILTEEKAAIMVRALLNLFHDLGKRVIAEGVEEAEQAALLRSLGADMIQGFHYARPAPPEEITKYFS